MNTTSPKSAAITRAPITAPITRISLPTERTKPGLSIKQYMALYYGPVGVGKTTFVNGLADRVLFLSTDRGTRFMDAMRFECKRWEDFLAVIPALKALPLDQAYDMVCIDHVGDWAMMAETFVCAQMGLQGLADAEFGKGWSIFKKTMMTYIHQLAALNMGISFIAHEVIKEVVTRTVKLSRTMPDLPKSGWNVVIPIVDIIGYCGFKIVKGEDGKNRQIRIVDTRPREDLYVKDRTDRNRPSSGYDLLDGEKFAATFNL